MPLDLMLPPPAIVEFQSAHEVRFGLSYAPSRTELDRFIVPRDWREATIEELRAYIPSDLQDMPEWAIRGMFPLFARKVGGGASQPGVKTTVFLTSTSDSNQSWSALSDWNSSENIVHVIAGGGGGGGWIADGSKGGGGGGGGAYSRTENISLIPGSSIAYHLGPEPAGAQEGQAGSDVWFNGSTLALSSVGAKGGGGGTSELFGSAGGPGGDSADGVGGTKYSGGNGSSAGSNIAGAGGGAAGPNGNGGDASGVVGGTGGNGFGGSGGANWTDGSPGTEFQASPARGSGGGGGGREVGGFGIGRKGGNYGGGSGGATGVLAPDFDVDGAPGAQGLIVIINNHITGI